jgi:hypothetical protein
MGSGLLSVRNGDRCSCASAGSSDCKLRMSKLSGRTSVVRRVRVWAVRWDQSGGRTGVKPADAPCSETYCTAVALRRSPRHSTPYVVSEVDTQDDDDDDEGGGGSVREAVLTNAGSLR